MSGQRPEMVLSVENVGHIFRNRGVPRRALVDVTFQLARGRTIAVVGESGAGKSTLARLIAGLDRPTSGRILVRDRPPKLESGTASSVQMVFQDPTDALNPYHSVRSSIALPLRGRSRSARRVRVSELLETVGLDPLRASERPAEFSGGQQQRIVIARALAASPEILVCDEPTSALDVSVQGQIVNLLMDLQRSMGFGIVLVTHDLAVVRGLADDVLVLRNGVMLELSSAAEFFAGPRHEYSRELLEAAGGPPRTGGTKPVRDVVVENPSAEQP